MDGPSNEPAGRRDLGEIDLGALRRTSPISRAFGFERGQPVDRYYIERFLAEHVASIHGHVLEVGDDGYTRAFGGVQVKQSDVLSLTPDNRRATIVADLTDAPNIPTETFDCFILTQTLQFIYDLPAAIRTVHRILKPGGTLLVTVPALSQICRYDMDRWGDYWRFTEAALRRLLDGAFGMGQATVTAHGNVLAAISFLHGLAVEDLTPEELDAYDPDYQIVITGRVVRRS